MKTHRFFSFTLAMVALLLPWNANVQAQSEAVTPVGSINIVKEVKPPILQLQGQVAFFEPSGNNAIDANEQCSIRLTVKNTGMGDGYGLKARIRTRNSVPGVSVKDVTIPVLKVGESYTVVYPVAANMNTTDGTAEFLVGIEEPNGFSLPDVALKVPTRAFIAPMVEFRGHTVENGALTLARNIPYTIQVLVQNTGQGLADRVNVSLNLPDGVYQLGEVDGLHGGQLTPGQTKTIKYTLIIPQSYSQKTLPISVRISESYGRYSKDGNISFEVRDQRQEDIIISRRDEASPEIRIASLGSDVDRDIPRVAANNSTLHVMIIANQNYSDEKDVSTALSDGRMMKEYCVRTLGIPEKNVQLKENRTSAQMKGDVEAFCRTMRVNEGDRFYFFYYGHGMRSKDQNVADAYLVPVDGTSLRLEQTGVSRNWMMSQFEKAKPSQLVVCLESCFSGATESDNMLAYSEGSSGLRLVDDVKNTFKGNMVLITASSQAQTANAYPSQQHNVFTYELLKSLKNNKGEINWGDFFESVKRSTTRTAWNELGREQEPSITVSSTLGDAWKKWSVK